MILKGEMVAQMLPGQFLHIRVPDGSKLLRRPISISEIDPETQTCRLIYRIEGGGQLSFPNCQSVANSVSWGHREMALISPISAKVRKP
ncbi:dihydroorotate dehydrogenase electron transfer subunit [Streptococcus sp. ZB199]|nr:dihydroorotate dehydrogenase electron transfer subunit [Streptococcus sp. ZB199]